MGFNLGFKGLTHIHCTTVRAPLTYVLKRGPSTTN